MPILVFFLHSSLMETMIESDLEKGENDEVAEVGIAASSIGALSDCFGAHRIGGFAAPSQFVFKL